MKSIQHLGQTLHLHTFRAIYWEEADALIMADLHLGKAAHFRKSGIAAPASILNTNFKKLQQLIDLYDPKTVYFLGDLFHSHLNTVWERHVSFLSVNSQIQFILVKGNHDILPKAIYEQSEMLVCEAPLLVEPFVFSHYPLEASELDTHYNFYGHLHPGVLLQGSGKQYVKLACFHFGKQQAVLPAFGAFTGLSLIQPESGDRTFVIVEDEIMEV